MLECLSRVHIAYLSVVHPCLSCLQCVPLLRMELQVTVMMASLGTCLFPSLLNKL
jgi:hypothetical protein